MAFTPDGSQLVTTLVDRPYLRVWDLRAIRRRLAGLGLDWDPPASFDTADAPGSFPRSPSPSASIAASSIPGCNEAPRRPSRSWSGRPGRSRPTPTTPRPTTSAAMPCPAEAVRGGHRRLHRRAEVQPERCPPAGLPGARGGAPEPARRGDRRRRGGAAARWTASRQSRMRRAGLAHVLQRPGLDAGDRPGSTRPGPRRWTWPGCAVGADPRPVDLPQHARRRPLPRRPATPRPCPSWSAALLPARARSDAFDLFFLAMARHRLGHAARPAPT